MTELICIVCPKGCHLKVDETQEYAVTGNSCPRGEEYGRTELLNPTRVLTSVVRLAGEKGGCCPVKTNGGIPKKDIFAAMEVLKGVRIAGAVKIGDVVFENICGTGIDWVATKNVLG